VIALATNARPARRDLATDLRLALLRVLSPDGRCRKCKKRVGVDHLEIDHVDGRQWSNATARMCSRPQRIKRYWREFLDGVRLRALCVTCNRTDGANRRWGNA
jgi:hypothetical protein